MNFKKDILLIDLEFTGLNVDKHEIIQFAAVLLDKKTLKEKAFFNSYAAPGNWKNRDRESMKVNKIKSEWLKAAPSLNTVLNNFNKKFKPANVILSYYGGPADMDFLRAAYKRAGVKWQFDYHYFNLWAVFYAYLASNNKLKASKEFAGFNLDYLMKALKIKPLLRHDALADCRMEAEVLRRIIFQIKK